MTLGLPLRLSCTVSRPVPPALSLVTVDRGNYPSAINDTYVGQVSADDISSCWASGPRNLQPDARSTLLGRARAQIPIAGFGSDTGRTYIPESQTASGDAGKHDTCQAPCVESWSP